MSSELVTPTDRIALRHFSELMESNQINALREFLKNHSDLMNKKYNEGTNMTVLDVKLKFAGMAGSLDIVKLFVEFGADINREESERQRNGLICKVAGTGHVEVMRWLLTKGAIINHVRDGKLVSDTLITSAMDGQLEEVKLLLANGAALNGLSLNRMTALDFAIMYGHREVETYLRLQGAKSAAELSPQSSAPRSNTPISTIGQHLLATFDSGRLQYLHTIIPTSLPCQVCRLNLDNAIYLVTEGLNIPTRHPKDAKPSHRAELYLRIPVITQQNDPHLQEQTLEWAVRWLALVGQSMIDQKWEIEPMVIPLPVIDDIAPFQSALLLELIDLLPPCESNDETITSFFYAWPMNADEYRFAQEHGITELIQRFNQSPDSFWLDLDRNELIN